MSKIQTIKEIRKYIKEKYSNCDDTLVNDCWMNRFSELSFEEQTNLVIESLIKYDRDYGLSRQLENEVKGNLKAIELIDKMLDALLNNKNEEAKILMKSIFDKDYLKR